MFILPIFPKTLETLGLCLNLLLIANLDNIAFCADRSKPELMTLENAILSDTSLLKLKPRELPDRYNECAYCHVKKDRFFAKKSKATVLEHVGISPTHGTRDLSCNSCHDINNHNFLRGFKDHPADFTNPSPTCARCHLEKFRSWKKGLHGKRTGGWMQPKIQFHCIDCHNPHKVKFPSMQTVEDPVLSPYVIPKPEHHDNGSDSKGESH